MYLLFVYSVTTDFVNRDFKNIQLQIQLFLVIADWLFLDDIVYGSHRILFLLADGKSTP